MDADEGQLVRLKASAFAGLPFTPEQLWGADPDALGVAALAALQATAATRADRWAWADWLDDELSAKETEEGMGLLRALARMEAGTMPCDDIIIAGPDDEPMFENRAKPAPLAAFLVALGLEARVHTDGDVDFVFRVPGDACSKQRWRAEGDPFARRVRILRDVGRAVATTVKPLLTADMTAECQLALVTHTKAHD